MTLRKILVSVTSILLSSVFALSPIQATTLPDALPRHRLCQPCKMPSLPIVLPRQGMAFSYGSILSSGSLWYLADFERGEATRILARDERDGATLRLIIVERTTRRIPASDLARLTQIGNEIWGLKDRLPAQISPDVVWNLWLLDGTDVRYEFAPGGPVGLAKEVEQILDRLLKPEPVQASTS